MTFTYDVFWIVVGFLLTVMVLSYLLGDNLFFRLAAHLFIGITSGYVVLLILQEIAEPLLIRPLTTGPWLQRLWLAVPIILILMLFLSPIKRFRWMGSVPLAYLAGLTAAVTIGGAVFGTIIPQSSVIINSFDPVRLQAVPDQAWLRIVDGLVMLVGTIGTLSYFHFGRKRHPQSDEDLTKRPLILEVLSKIGQVFIGITLGAVFAGVFSSALMALIDRILSIGQFITCLIGSI
jgi:hypothetical protein